MTFRLRSFYNKQVIKFPGSFLLAGNVRNKGYRFNLSLGWGSEVRWWWGEGLEVKGVCRGEGSEIIEKGWHILTFLIWPWVSLTGLVLCCVFHLALWEVFFLALPSSSPCNSSLGKLEVSVPPLAARDAALVWVPVTAFLPWPPTFSHCSSWGV